MFMANIHEHAVLSDVLVPKGSGFVAEHADEVMMANNAQWIGFSMEIGPDGMLYLSDPNANQVLRYSLKVANPIAELFVQMQPGELTWPSLKHKRRSA